MSKKLFTISINLLLSCAFQIRRQHKFRRITDEQLQKFYFFEANQSPFVSSAIRFGCSLCSIHTCIFTIYHLVRHFCRQYNTSGSLRSGKHRNVSGYGGLVRQHHRRSRSGCARSQFELSDSDNKCRTGVCDGRYADDECACQHDVCVADADLEIYIYLHDTGSRRDGSNQLHHADIY